MFDPFFLWLESTVFSVWMRESTSVFAFPIILAVHTFHRLVPFAVLGFAINIASRSTFLMTEPNQYIYNPAFHFKMLFLALAGLNVLVFYVTMFRRVCALGPGAPTPPLAKISGAASLMFWTAVIVCGRLITFYRPNMCRPGAEIGFIADCILRL